MSKFQKFSKVIESQNRETMFTTDSLIRLFWYSCDVGNFLLQNSNLSIFPKKQTLFCFRGILFRQLKTIRCSEAVYNEWEIKPVTLSWIPPLLYNERQKKAFCFKGKVRKIGQYIFLLRNNINSYNKSNCNKRNWTLACTYSLKRQQAIELQEHNVTCLHLILLHVHLQMTPSLLVPHWS